MEGLVKKKLNMLAHLAKIDGHFADAEREVLYEIAREYGKKDEEIIEIVNKPEPDNDFSALSEYHKLEFIFIAIRIMKADGVIHDNEVDYCKGLAKKMGFDPKVIDDFAHSENIHFDDFLVQGKKYFKN